MSDTQRILIAIATYNEVENLPRLVDEIRHYVPNAEMVVVDDNSPDGTGRWCDDRAAQDSRFHVIHRTGKLGLGTATMAGLRYAMDHDFDLVVTLDADFSHPPRYLPSMIEAINEPGASRDLVIGSRYVAGGGVEGWPLRRRLMSRGVNAYARLMLGLTQRDCSGAFRCFRVDSLRRVDWTLLRSRGYSFLEEMLWMLKNAGARIHEVPITFVDRTQGQSKVNLREAWAALWIIFRLAFAKKSHAA